MGPELENAAGVLSRREDGDVAVLCGTGRGKAAASDGERVTQIRKLRVEANWGLRRLQSARRLPNAICEWCERSTLANDGDNQC